MRRKSLKAVFDFWSRDRTYNRISLWAYLEGRADQAASEARPGLAIVSAWHSRYAEAVNPKVWVKKVPLAQAERSEQEYYASLSAEQRLEIVQQLREMIHKFGHERGKGLRRVHRVTKRR